MAKEPNDDENAARIMPSRSFYGQSSNQFIHNLIRPGWRLSNRPLAPLERNLGPFILPAFQRPMVWTPEQKVRLIESLYMGMPIGALVHNQTILANQWCDGWLLDGQQRLSTILEYADGGFAVNGWLYPDLPDIEKRHFLRIGIPLIETSISSEALCHDVYNRLTYGGTAHAPKPAQDDEADAAIALSSGPGGSRQ